MTHNANNEAYEEQNACQDMDEEDEIQPIPSLEGQIKDRIEQIGCMIEDANQVEELMKDKEPNATGSDNVPNPIEHANHKKSQKATDWGPLFLLVESQGNVYFLEHRKPRGEATEYGMRVFCEPHNQLIRNRSLFYDKK